MEEGTDLEGAGVRKSQVIKRMMMARENTVNLKHQLTKKHLDQFELEWIATFGILDEMQRRETLAELEAMYLVGIDPYQIPGYIPLLRQKILNNWKMYTDSLDSTSKVAQSHMKTEMDRIDWKAYSSHFFLSPVTAVASSKLILVTGNLGFGKTNIATLYGELFRQDNPEGLVCVNYELLEEREGWRWCNKLSDLIRLASKSALEGITVLAILDESSIALGRQDVSTARFHNLNRLIKLLRKLKLIIVYIAQFRDEIPTRLLLHYALWIDKPAQKTARIQMRHGQYRVDSLVDNVPATKVKYNSEDFGTFNIDVDIRNLLLSMDTIRSGREKFVKMGSLLKKSKLRR